MSLSPLLQNEPWNALLRQEEVRLRPLLVAARGGTAVVLEAAGLPPALHAAATTLVLERGGRIERPVRARAQAWPLRPRSVDLLILRHATAQLDDPGPLLREAVRVLVPGGQLLLTGLHPYTVWHAWLRRSCADLTYRAWRPGLLEASLRAAGAVIDACERFGSVLPVSASAAGGGPLAACFLVHARRCGLGAGSGVRAASRVRTVGVAPRPAGAGAHRQRLDLRA